VLGHRSDGQTRDVGVFAAEGDVVDRVAAAPQRHVPAGEDELELAAARLAEDGDGLIVAEAAAVILQLLVETRDPVGNDQALENLAE